MIETERQATLAQEVILKLPDTAKNSEEKTFKRGITKDKARADRSGHVLDIPGD